MIIWVFPAAPLRSAAGRYVTGSAIAPASSASPTVAAYGAFHIANTGANYPKFPDSWFKFESVGNSDRFNLHQVQSLILRIFI